MIEKRCVIYQGISTDFLSEQQMPEGNEVISSKVLREMSVQVLVMAVEEQIKTPVGSVVWRLHRWDSNPASFSSTTQILR